MVSQVIKKFAIRQTRKCPHLQGLQTLSPQAAATELTNSDIMGWQQAWPYEELPGPTKFELIRGSLPGGVFYKKTFSDFILGARQQYGEVFRVPGMLGKKDFVMIFGVDNYQKVSRTEGIYPERPGLDALIFYRNKYRSDIYSKTQGLSASVGESWCNFRKAVNPVLMEPRNAKSYLMPMQAVNSEFIQRIRDIRDPVSLEVPDNFVDDISRLTFESVAVVALDKPLGLIRKYKDGSHEKNLFDSLKVFMQLEFQLDFQPSLYKYVWTPSFARFRKALDVIIDTTQVYVEEAIQRYHDEKREALDDSELSILEKLYKIDKSVAFVMGIDMLIAGVDTTTTSLTGILLEVAKNPQKQSKIRNEVRQFLPRKDSLFTVESMKNLPYLRACIKEGMRMHNIGPGLLRAAGENITLGGYRIPKGTRLLLNNFLSWSEEKYFSRPNEFIPERWLRDGSADEIQQFSYLPFGFGRRMCVGKRIVTLEMEVAIARLVRNFHIELNYPTENAFSGFFVNTRAIPLKFKFTEVDD